MPEPIIRVNNLSKKYIIKHQNTSYVALRDVIAEKAESLFAGRKAAQSKEDFWALKGVSFDLNPGDRLGIIGRNGAGKSTLLKLLSRITTPTTGSILYRGRVGSLLEVGTGFHPELTGRENIFLNGAILGMKREYVKKRFDEIVEFAEVEKFLDTPVKRFSSGMYVRLAFSVAAHLEPDILIVDEVLAVGDAQFQKKCLGKMKDISQEGRTLLFVSHNMGAVRNLCNKGLYLSKGQMQGPVDDIQKVITTYLNDTANKDIASQWQNSGSEYQNEWIVPLSMKIIDDHGEDIQGHVSNDQDFYLEVQAEVRNVNSALTFGYAIFNEDGNLLYWSYPTDRDEASWPELSKGIYQFRTKIPKRLFNEGTYRIEFIASLHFIKWIIEPGKDGPAIFFSIEGGLSDSPLWQNKRMGILAPVLHWETKRLRDS